MMACCLGGATPAGAAGIDPYLSEVWLTGPSDWPAAGTVVPGGFEVTVPDGGGSGAGSGGMTLLMMSPGTAQLPFGTPVFQLHLPAQAAGTAVAVTENAWPADPLPQSMFRLMADLPTGGGWRFNQPVSLLLFDGVVNFNAPVVASILSDQSFEGIRETAVLLDAVTLVEAGDSTDIDDYAIPFEFAFGVDLRESVVGYTPGDRAVVRDVVNAEPIGRWGVGDPVAFDGVDQFEDDGRWFAATPGLRNVPSLDTAFGADLPEPGGLALVGFGLACLGWRCGRRRRDDA